MKSLASITDRAGLLTREYLPGWAPYLRRLGTPMGSLVMAAIASGLCGFFLHPQGFVVFVAIMAVMMLGLVWPWLSVRGLRGSLTFDRSRCREGETVVVQLTVHNRMPWGIWGVSIRGGFQQPERDGRDDEPLAGLAFVPGRRTIIEAVDFIPGCRGEYPAQPPRLVCGFPFGLWRGSRPLEVATPLLVWPRTVPVGPVPEAGGDRQSDGLATRDVAGHWGDPLGVRPYRRGDPLRRVHWGLSARHGELIVREVQSNAVPHVQIVLDARPAVHAGSGRDGSREWAIRIAASLAEGWVGQGAEVEVILDGTSVSSRGGSAWTRAAVLLDAMARLAPGDHADLAAMLVQAQGRGLRVVVTTDVGLCGLDEGRRRHGDRFVVLRAGAFDDVEREDAAFPLPLVPWISIDGPGRVATCLRRAGKEVALGN